MKLFLKKGVVCVLLLLAGLFASHHIMAGENPKWQKAYGKRSWSFPRDHGSHPAYRTEWWYFTGNLKDDSGSKYGYQLTFFRHGVRVKPADPKNPWSLRDIYFAHFTITDVKRKQFRMAERISRPGPGLAGAGKEKMDVWIFDWHAKMKGRLISLYAKKADMEIRLELRPKKPLVFHGKGGLSKKGPAKGQASFYTSFTDLETKGFLRTEKDSPLISVKGKSWFDHEFGSNQLTENQVGWDWFSLHLSDGRDLMIYLMRKKDGSFEKESSGTLVEKNGRSKHIRLKDISIEVLQKWKSQKSGGLYPGKWRLRIPKYNIDLLISPLLADQELNAKEFAKISYWEGAVFGQGSSKGKDVALEGYVELTGYAKSLGGAF